MKLVALVFATAALIAHSSAAAVVPQEPIPILQMSNTGSYPNGYYAYSYRTGNGIEFEEQGEQKPLQDRRQSTTGLAETSDDNSANSVNGRYSYTDENGRPIQVTYTADERGFRPSGEHLPVVPPAIVRALEWIAAHPEEDNA